MGASLLFLAFQRSKKVAGKQMIHSLKSQPERVGFFCVCYLRFMPVIHKAKIAWVLYGDVLCFLAG